ncbi:DUF1569 domain-containing protein [Pontibacter fetidus]|uniref:DUF1569 domain-containing protein n=1 Tax=Pontibacter fetidus TaxID=2700082 RepID=A0A6B2H6B8_9BACT|nr:DUF1569 domain-containing protein [Pontibacter fetidus]NDK55400.1 DUF1569 domain-containing protein [Pontibacter fetidus]
MKNVFIPETTDELIARIQMLTSDTKPLWGKMDVAQMLAHCSVTYEMVYEEKYPRPNPFMKLLLKLLVKNYVVNEKPYKQNAHTAPQFIITSDKDFEAEIARLINYIRETQQLGTTHFEGKESISFGALTSQQWNNMFYKHLNHHLTQFGV